MYAGTRSITPTGQMSRTNEIPKWFIFGNSTYKYKKTQASMNTKSVSKGPFSAEEVRWLLQASETQQWLLLSSDFHFIAGILRFVFAVCRLE